MFILRTVHQHEMTSNESISDRYSICYQSNNNEFEKTVAAFEKFGVYDQNVYGFVVTENKIIALRRGRHHYIMTESGKTFEKIHFEYRFIAHLKDLTCLKEDDIIEYNSILYRVCFNIPTRETYLLSCEKGYLHNEEMQNVLDNGKRIGIFQEWEKEFLKDCN
jgi:hypothetical protein